MNEDRSNGLSNEEREAFRSLGEIRVYSTKHEDHVVRALRKKGLVRSPAPPAWRRAARYAAVAAALVGAFYLGAEFGGRGPEAPVPVVHPIGGTEASGGDFMVLKYEIEESPVFEDYRDEPDRRDDGVLFAKISGQ